MNTLFHENEESESATVEILTIPNVQNVLKILEATTALLQNLNANYSVGR
jgi:hypothetical protein